MVIIDNVEITVITRWCDYADNADFVVVVFSDPIFFFFLLLLFLL